MTTEQRIIELSRRLDEWHEENIRRANKSKYENLSYILWGFALATTSLAITNPHGATISIAIIFLVMGFVTLGYSAKFRARQH